MLDNKKLHDKYFKKGAGNFPDSPEEENNV